MAQWMSSKKEIVFSFVSGENETMDEHKERNCVNNFLTEVGRWMNLGKFDERNRIMELRRVN